MASEGHDLKRYLDLPSKIFLDLGTEFSFSVIINVFEDISDLHSLRLSFMLSNTTFVTVTSTRRIQLETHSIIYDVVITDNGRAGEGASGESFAITSLLITPQESSFECIYKSNAVINIYLTFRFT
jgi:hypothetical protein